MGFALYKCWSMCLKAVCSLLEEFKCMNLYCFLQSLSVFRPVTGCDPFGVNSPSKEVTGSQTFLWPQTHRGSIALLKRRSETHSHALTTPASLSQRPH